MWIGLKSHLDVPGRKYQTQEKEKKEKKKGEEREREFKLDILERTVIFVRHLIEKVKQLEEEVVKNKSLPLLVSGSHSGESTTSNESSDRDASQSKHFKRKKNQLQTSQQSCSDERPRKRSRVDSDLTVTTLDECISRDKEDYEPGENVVIPVTSSTFIYDSTCISSSNSGYSYLRENIEAINPSQSEEGSVKIAMTHVNHNSGSSRPNMKEDDKNIRYPKPTSQVRLPSISSLLCAPPSPSFGYDTGVTSTSCHRRNQGPSHCHHQNHHQALLGSSFSTCTGNESYNKDRHITTFNNSYSSASAGEGCPSPFPYLSPRWSPEIRFSHPEGRLVEGMRSPHDYDIDDSSCAISHNRPIIGSGSVKHVSLSRSSNRDLNSSFDEIQKDEQECRRMITRASCSHMGKKSERPLTSRLEGVESNTSVACAQITRGSTALAAESEVGGKETSSVCSTSSQGFPPSPCEDRGRQTLRTRAENKKDGGGENARREKEEDGCCGECGADEYGDVNDLDGHCISGARDAVNDDDCLGLPSPPPSGRTCITDFGGIEGRGDEGSSNNGFGSVVPLRLPSACLDVEMKVRRNRVRRRRGKEGSKGLGNGTVREKGNKIGGGEEELEEAEEGDEEEGGYGDSEDSEEGEGEDENDDDNDDEGTTEASLALLQMRTRSGSLTSVASFSLSNGNGNHTTIASTPVNNFSASNKINTNSTVANASVTTGAATGSIAIDSSTTSTTSNVYVSKSGSGGHVTRRPQISTDGSSSSSSVCAISTSTSHLLPSLLSTKSQQRGVTPASLLGIYQT